MKLASFKIRKERVLLNWQLKATVSVEIVGTFYCLLDRPPMLVPRFGELTAINNILGERGQARRKKNNVYCGSVPTIFVRDCSSHFKHVLFPI